MNKLSRFTLLFCLQILVIVPLLWAVDGGAHDGCSTKVVNLISESRTLSFQGPAGSGKGTAAREILKIFKMRHLSIGDILRAEVATGSELGLSAKAYMDRGELVPADINRAVLLKYFKNADPSVGEILDGAPRKEDQLTEVESILGQVNRQIDIVFEFVVDFEASEQRILGRLICPKCQATFHKESNKPKVDGICDHCGGNLVTRRDDNADMAKKRWTVFVKETRPILDIFEQRGILYLVDARGSVDDVVGKIMDILESTQGRRPNVVTRLWRRGFVKIQRLWMGGSARAR